MNASSYNGKLLVRLGKNLLRAQGREPSEVSQFLADDFVEFGSFGRCFTKLELIQALHT